ncbi:MAG: ASCH domain-containing protein [Deltaproteobacteria bacterium]|nr:ASCH domain-containing protein [Deltaproteobacteria bacterium]
MKTLSVRQPWTSLIVAGIKSTENRSWKTNHRGRLLIHAGRRDRFASIAHLRAANPPPRHLRRRPDRRHLWAHRQR